MLNIGQVVYDYTNERVLIFAGLEMLQRQNTGECTVHTAFILKDGAFILFKDNDGKERFEYTNFVRDGKAYVGSFIAKCGLGGCFFGIIDESKLKEEDFQWIKEAIEEAEVLIEAEGLNTVEKTFNKKTYNEYHIGKVKEREIRYSVDAPSLGPKNAITS
jgi:hypothetical protein